MPAEKNLTEPLIDLLYAAPQPVVFLVQDAIRAVAAGDWFRASSLMGFAAEAHDAPDEWPQRAGRSSDELWSIASSRAIQ